MVRLRSERWFSADGQRRSRALVQSRTSGTRRLTSLCFLLALVVLLMQKAADPKHVSHFFRSLGVPLEESPKAALEAPTSSRTHSLRSPASSPHPEAEADWIATCNDLVPRLLEEATESQILELGQAWFSVAQAADTDSQSQRSDDTLRYRDRTLATLDSIRDSLGAEDESWSRRLVQFRAEWLAAWKVFAGSSVRDRFPSATNADAAVDPHLAIAITEYLDDRLTRGLEDASPWSRKESVAFWRLLQRGQGRGRRHPADHNRLSPRISTLQLESDDDIYKGHWIRFRGSVRRIEKVERQNTSFGIDGYFLIWLRGADGSTQPVAIYATTTDLEPFSTSLEDTPESPIDVEVAGVVGKRLAYASSSGIQVAPTLFAGSVNALTPSPSPALVPIESTRWDDLQFSLLGGGLLAGVILIPIWFRFRRSPRRPTFKRTLKSPPKLSLLAFLVVSLGLCGSGVAQERIPPWAANDGPDAQWQTLLETRLRAAWNGEGVDALESYLAGEQEAFPDAALRTLHVLERLGWKRQKVSPQAIQLNLSGDETEEDWRIQPIELSGIVRLAMPISLSQDQLDWFQRDDEPLYRVEVELDHDLFGPKANDAGSSWTVENNLLTVFTQHVPSQWLTSVKLRQTVRMDGFALLAAPSSVVCGFVKQFDWVLPASDAIAVEPKLPEHLVTLGKLGWNLAWLDTIAAHQQKPLDNTESEAFYRLLNLADNELPLLQAATIETDAMRAFAHPSESIGQPIRWNVRLVTGSVVQVESEAAQMHLGSDRYFQLDGFVHLGDQRILYQVRGKDGKEDVQFEREFPIIIVTRDPAEWLSPERRTSGELTWRIGKFAEVEGRFFRLWSFQSELMQSKNSEARQAAPLVVATRLRETLPPLGPAAGGIGWFGYALCIATLVILAAILFLVLRKDPLARRL